MRTTDKAPRGLAKRNVSRPRTTAEQGPHYQLRVRRMHSVGNMNRRVLPVVGPNISPGLPVKLCKISRLHD